MFEAILIGALAQVSLVLSGLVVYVVNVPRRIVGVLAGYGAGALLGAIAFDLIPESEQLDTVQSAIWLLAGAAVFVAADWFVESRMGGGEDDAAPEGDGGGEGAQRDNDGGSPLGIVVGAVVDGIPESMIFGIQLAAGVPLSAAFVAAVFVSNIPQALAPSVDLARTGWTPIRLGAMWAIVVVACGLTAGLGYVVGDAFGLVGDRAAAFAAGGLLAMMTNSLMPFAFSRGGAAAGVMTVVGFAVSLAGAQG